MSSVRRSPSIFLALPALISSSGNHNHFGAFGPRKRDPPCGRRPHTTGFGPVGVFPSQAKRLFTGVFSHVGSKDHLVNHFYEGSSVDSVAARRPPLPSPFRGSFPTRCASTSTLRVFFFRALLMDARGSGVPAQGTHFLRSPRVTQLCSLSCIRGLCFDREYRFRAHRADARWRTGFVHVHVNVPFLWRRLVLRSLPVSDLRAGNGVERGRHHLGSCCVGLRLGSACCRVVVFCLLVHPSSPHVCDAPDDTRREKFLHVFLISVQIS